MKRCNVYTGIRNLPRPLEPERLKTLVQRLRQGDESVKSEIIYGHLRLAISIVGQNARNNNDSDMLGEVFLQLVRAVNRAGSKLTDDNITAYLASNMRWSCRQVLRRDRLLHVPLKALKKGRKPFNRITVESPEETLFQPELDHHFTELLDLVINTPIENEVIQQRIAGYTDEQIAAHFKRSRSFVQHTRSTIETRFAEKESRRPQKARLEK